MSSLSLLFRLPLRLRVFPSLPVVVNSLSFPSVVSTSLPLSFRKFTQNRGFSSTTHVPSPIEMAAIRALQTIETPKNSLPKGMVGTHDVHFSGLIHKVSFEPSSSTCIVTLQPTVDFRELKSQITSTLTDKLKSLDENIKVTVIMAKPSPPPIASQKAQSTPSGLSRVKHLIAVSSCKGGVGKSTVALNVAFSLKSLGHRVGIIDCDVHGPSLPFLVNTEKDIAGHSQMEGSLIDPLTFQGVSLMSFGYLGKGNVKNAAIMRGAMVSNVIRDLLTKTNWPTLDYLIIDMPPGTGDVAITLLQSLNLSGALVVTAPQRLAFVDVVKGIELFIKTRVPILSVAENFAFFQCDSCDKQHDIFGKSHLGDLQKDYGDALGATQRIPMAKEINDSIDDGIPFVTDERAKSPAALKAKEAFKSLAKQIVDQTTPQAIAAHPFNQRYAMEFSADTPLLSFVVNEKSRERIPVSTRRLRLACRCAACVDERTGQRKIVDETIREDIRPMGFEKKGNYAVGIHFSDGHKSTIMGWEEILKIAQEEKQKK